MKIKDISYILESEFPLALKESYDNSGLLLGSKENEITGILISLDLTENVLNEAISKKCNLIINHHPIIFKGILNLTEHTEKNKILINAIKNDIAIYALHTNLDNSINGINALLAEKLSIINIKILKFLENSLRKLVVYCPNENVESVRNSIFETGGGQIGNYDQCSFNTEGEGTFKANENANPYIGTINELHFEKETKIETIYPIFLEENILSSMIKAHPYEEVAYDIYPLKNSYKLAGSGIIGELEKKMTKSLFLKMCKTNIQSSFLKVSNPSIKQINKVAICSGSGNFLIKEAILQGADAFITADLKYHDFQDYGDKILLVDAGHYETENCFKEIIFKFLTKKIHNFAIFISEQEINPVFYL